MDFIKLLDEKPEAWNEWRSDNENIWPDLSGMDLSGKDLSCRVFHYVKFTGANLIGTKLNNCNLSSADFTFAQMQNSTINDTFAEWASFSDACLDNATIMGSNFEKARLDRASMIKVNAANTSFYMAILDKTNLTEAYLSGTSFLRASMRGVILDRAELGLTLFVDTNLYGATGLGTCIHGSFSFLDHRTVAQSGKMDNDFMIGIGLPEALRIHYPDLVKGSVRYMDCFISCSDIDIEFAELLKKNLEANGVKCWLYTHDMPWGGRLWDSIDDAIEKNDKLILILSEYSIQSEWVEDEVTKSFAEERIRKEDILLPLMVDDAVMASVEPWASKIKNSRSIADFRHWREPVQYVSLLDKLMKVLLKQNPIHK